MPGRRRERKGTERGEVQDLGMSLEGILFICIIYYIYVQFAPNRVKKLKILYQKAVIPTFNISFLSTRSHKFKMLLCTQKF